MSTRGLWGLRRYGIDKLTYNHSDSYPEYLGRMVAQAIQACSDEQFERAFDNIALVKEHDTPTRAELRRCLTMGYCELHVGDQNLGVDWYCALRNLQGQPLVVIHDAENSESDTWMIDSRDFIKDSLFCEHAYIINLDDHVLEYWLGFNTEPDPDCRYGAEPYDTGDDTKYYPCHLVLEMSFDLLRTMSLDDIVEKMNEAAREADDLQAVLDL